MPLHFSECMTENAFTWRDGETGKEMSFAIDRIPAYVKEHKLPKFMTPVEEEWARLFVRDHGIEKHRIARLSLKALKTPVIYAHMPGDTHILIDGSHRYVYAAAMGIKAIPAYILEQEHWEPFVITGLPDIGEYNLRTMYSGIG